MISLNSLSDESSTPAFVLPSGSAAEDHRIAIEIEVEDRFGDTTGLNISVSVKVSMLGCHEGLYKHKWITTA